MDKIDPGCAWGGIGILGMIICIILIIIHLQNTGLL
jgi:hypothetical protein